MHKLASISLIATLALSAACEAKLGKEADAADSGSAANAGASSAEGKAEENTFSMKMPGVDIKVAIPESVRANATFDGDSDIIYPGARFNGLHVQGEKEGAGRHGGVEIRFASTDPAEKIAAWYRDPARKDFSVASANQEGNGFKIAGKQKDGDAITVHLAPKPGGGTDGRLVIQSDT